MLTRKLAVDQDQVGLSRGLLLQIVHRPPVQALQDPLAIGGQQLVGEVAVEDHPGVSVLLDEGDASRNLK